MLGHHRHQHRRENQHRGREVERSADHDHQHHHDEHEQRLVVQERLEQLDDLARDVGDGDQPRADHGRGDQEHHDGGRLAGGEDEPVQLAQLQLAVDEHADHEAVDGGDHRGLSRREHAHLHAAKDHDRKHQRPEALGGDLQALLHRHARRRLDLVALGDPPPDCQHARHAMGGRDIDIDSTLSEVDIRGFWKGYRAIMGF